MSDVTRSYQLKEKKKNLTMNKLTQNANANEPQLCNFLPNRLMSKQHIQIVRK